ncbi:Cof-type HAD-IIB family hydrolase [Afipia broomeae]|jgi:Cof subfamily protein (haloacid dehalogenase superfamily)|uniref:Cof-like hydrolase n=1 Tax=Afipia broomeae ATCC 49717 TaxID=883078 RepID=K8PPI3_9BRAD|nr:Cof-type HAD-IIB family hydrolase [Afipia broomeae]EKS41425.1 cof-like hydrolase [Afipia broomeae ATCC 49717]
MTPIQLLVSDVDGTLVTPDKKLTPATLDAVSELRAKGILFTITSSRPPIGLRMLVEPLGIALPMGPFNGSSIVNPDLTVDEQHTIPKLTVMESLALFARRGIDAWIFTNRRWVIHRDDGQYVSHEQQTIQAGPLIVDRDELYVSEACKVVGVSADFSLLAECETELRHLLGAEAHVARSQDYYLDVTPPGYDKGSFVAAIGKRLDIPPQAIATIGDMSNDLPMFRAAGTSFAMGNASDAIKAQAAHITASNTDDGFAKAVATILKANDEA